MVRGRRNYINHTPLAMGLAVLFRYVVPRCCWHMGKGLSVRCNRVDESSAAAHVGERRPAVYDDQAAADVADPKAKQVKSTNSTKSSGAAAAGPSTSSTVSDHKQNTQAPSSSSAAASASTSAAATGRKAARKKREERANQQDDDSQGPTPSPIATAIPSLLDELQESSGSATDDEFATDRSASGSSVRKPVVPPADEPQPPPQLTASSSAQALAAYADMDVTSQLLLTRQTSTASR